MKANRHVNGGASSQDAQRCLSCGLPSSYRFHLLTVRTLPVRDISGEKKVQALGDFVDYAVCKDCAMRHLDQLMHPLTTSLKKCLLFGGISLAGALLSLFFWHRDRVIFLFGLAAILAGILGIFGTLQGALAKKDSYQKLSEKERLYQAAFDLLVALAPKKNGDEDLSYIPVDGKTLSAKKGDLMVLYGLLPDIAVEAYKKIREERDHRPREGASYL